MTKLIISGKKSYTTRMYKHLRKEHPSTRHRMKLQDKIEKDKDSNIKVVHRDNSTVYQCKKCGAFYDATHKNQARYCCEDRKDYESMKRLKRGWY